MNQWIVYLAPSTQVFKGDRMVEYFLFGMFLGALFAVAFYLGWRMGIDNYLKRARAHVKKYGDKYL